MKCVKRLTLTGYQVEYVDLRDAKPRPIHKEVYPMDEDQKAACFEVGTDVPELIRSRYERGGYHVISVSKLPEKHLVAVNLRHLWESADE